MLRYRRYRGFLAFACFAVVGLYFLLVGSPEWQPASAIAEGALKGAGIQPDKAENPRPAFVPDLDRQAFHDLENDLNSPNGKPAAAQAAHEVADPRSTLGDALVQSTNTKKETIPQTTTLEAAAAQTVAVEDKGAGLVDSDAQVEEGGRGRLEVAVASASSAIHWTSQKEHFPVTSTITIPLGKPSRIPRIQYEFKAETPAQKEKRLEKLQAIKDTTARSWEGYKLNAWLHDEVKPESGRYRDPFCGWSATLVDALDTLWIMGMKDEFEDAVEAVGTIDFTTSPRKDIPLFETTIRYLGGMLAAYDISGHKYAILLDKSVELANILMGAFDTPNRMPVTYYNWMPAFASQPHRASTRVVLAELGSLSLEFTRLAQLTKEPRYYDAIDRITDAFAEWQNRENGTLLPGLFPTFVDASGCEKPAQIVTHPGSGNKAFKPDSSSPSSTDGRAGSESDSSAGVGWNPEKAIPFNGDRSGKEKPEAAIGQPASKTKSAGKTNVKQSASQDPDDSEAAIARVGSNPEKAIPVSGDRPKKADGAASAGEAPELAVGSATGVDLEEEEPLVAGKPGRSKIAAWGDPIKEGNLDSKENKAKLLQGKASELGSALDKRQLGGVLAGGSQEEIDMVEAKSSVKASDDETLPAKAIKNKNPHMPDAGAVSGSRANAAKSMSSSAQNDLQVCLPQGLTSTNKHGSDKFTLGGMADSTYEYLPKEYILLGGLEDKYRLLYEQSIDVASEKLLYRPSTPENHDILFSGEWRAFTGSDGSLNGTLHPEAQHLACFVGGMYGLGAKLFNRPNDLELAIKLTEGCVWAYASTPTGIMPEGSEVFPCEDRDNCKWDQAKYYMALDTRGPTPSKVKTLPPQAQRPATKTDKTTKDAEHAEKPKIEAAAKPDLEDEDDLFKRALDYKQKSAHTELETDDYPKVGTAHEKMPTDDLVSDAADSDEVEHDDSHELPRTIPKDGPTRVRPTYNNAKERKAEADAEEEDELTYVERPPRLSHEEFAKQRIEKERLPPGFILIGARGYILRPEAIESVWYMYRITGDPHWREVGWNMWTAVSKHTKARFGNSAIDDVTVDVEAGGKVSLKDEEESFWLAETVKYFYLLFADESVVSLDEWVLNTEAHPFRRPDFVDSTA